jgi:hypothetical protein
VTRRGVFFRTIIACLIVIAVILLPESAVSRALIVLSAILFLSMGLALIFPWRKPDLLGWEFFGLFATLGIVFGVGAAQTFGWLPLVLPFVYRAGVRALLVIFEAGVLTGLVRVGTLQWTAAAEQREDVILRLSAVEERVSAEERRNDRSEALSREAVARADVAEHRADESQDRADVAAEQRADHEERIGVTEAATHVDAAPAIQEPTVEIEATLRIPEQRIVVDNKPKQDT